MATVTDEQVREPGRGYSLSLTGMVAREERSIMKDNESYTKTIREQEVRIAELEKALIWIRERLCSDSWNDAGTTAIEDLINEVIDE